MLDLSAKWPLVSLARQKLAVPGLEVRTLDGISQHLVSGNLANWNRLAGMGGDGVGGLGLATGASYTVRVAKDRMLAVNPRTGAVTAGWHSDGFGVTDVSAGLCMIEMRGEHVVQIIRRAVALDPREVSPSASCQFAQVNGIVYYHGDRNTLRLHVDRSLAPHVWKWLEINLSPAVCADS